MPTIDPRVDAYIEKSTPFARPILKKLRSLVHKGCPDVVETIKWGMPSFEHPRKSILCGFAAFKHHCAFGFWKSAILFGDDEASKRIRQTLNWGAPGRDPVPARIERTTDLPSDAAMVRLIRRAAQLNEQGVKLPAPVLAKKPAPRTPTDLATALARSRPATANFKAFSPSHKREYIEWIVEAKQPATRQRRIATAVEWIAEGKGRNWKYERRK
jgi:uncharacterized protein YdeI (YjbR/CyaY-like superfamily)